MARRCQGSAGYCVLPTNSAATRHVLYATSLRAYSVTRLSRSAYARRYSARLIHFLKLGIMMLSIYTTVGVSTRSSAVAERPRAIVRVIEYFASHSRSLNIIPNDTPEWLDVSPY